MLFLGRGNNLKANERLRNVAYQLNCNLAEHDLHDLFESAYKAMHSTETALVRIYNDILQSVDAGNCVILIFLDMSAAFDTVVHDVLLDRLANRFGVRDVVLSGLYLPFKGNQQLVQLRQSLEQGLTDISSWMLANGLRLNYDKTELMCIHCRYFLSRPPLGEIVVCG